MIVALVFRTTNTLAILNATLASPMPSGPLDPEAGTFTTVTNFLKGDYGKVLGPPIAGMHFYVSVIH